jgi:pimeloyl-ACP methyl ester carboxylesterase
LGQLTNRIASHASKNPILQQVRNKSAITASNTAKSLNTGAGLTNIDGKPTFVRQIGKADGPPVVFVHGLGGTSDFWTPLVASADLASTHALHLFDWEGHGLSPTSALSKLSLASLSTNISNLFTTFNIAPGATLIAHSLGCLIAMKFVLDNPGRVGKLILVGPPPSPLPEAGSKGSHARAALVRAKGMSAVVDAVSTAGTSAKTQAENPLAVAAVRMSLLGQDPEGYAKGCTTLAEATQELNVAAIDAQTLIVTGEEDKISPPTLCEGYVKKLGKNSAGLKVLSGVGHWHVFEDLQGVADAVKGFL